MDFADSLGDCLVAARGAAAEVDRLVLGDDDGLRLQWLETQLASVVLELQNLLVDMETGMSIKDMGFSGGDEFAELIDGFQAEIASLKGQIRGLMLGKGR